MQIPSEDTPAIRLIEQGYGGADLDVAAVVDCMHLLRVSKRLLGHFYQLFLSHEISPGKYSVLCELLEANASVAPSTLADNIGVSRPTVTGLIDGLRKQGFVARQVDSKDRRKVSVRLTAQGERFIRELLPNQYSKMADLVNGLKLNEQERVQFRSTLLNLEGELS
jgi:DNA-binding MarR family transcriptional regulator